MGKKYIGWCVEMIVIPTVAYPGIVAGEITGAALSIKTARWILGWRILVTRLVCTTRNKQLTPKESTQCTVVGLGAR